MRKKYYIFVLTFLCMFVGQMGYGQDDYKGDVDHYDTLIWNGVEYEVNVTVYENGDDFINDHPDLDLTLTDTLNNEQYGNYLQSGGSTCEEEHDMTEVNEMIEDDTSNLHTVHDPIWTLTTPDEYVDNGDCTDYRSYAYPCETYIDYGDCSDYRSYAYPCDSNDPCDSSSSSFDSSLCEQLNSGDDGSQTNDSGQGTEVVCTKPCTTTQKSTTSKIAITYKSGVAMCPCEDNPKTKWFVDKDNDKYYDANQPSVESILSPGGNYIESTAALGVDCDDTKPLVWKLNSCNKCEVEPESTNWQISDVIANATGVLKEMIDKAKLTAPNLKIVKTNNNTDIEASSSPYCQKTTLGGGIGTLQADYYLAFELSHIVNRSQVEANFDAIFHGGSRSAYINSMARIEAEGYILSEIVKKEMAQNLNDCEKAILEMNSLNNDYSGKTLAEIKSLIRQNGELDAQTNFLLNSAASPGGQTIAQNYGKKYDDYKKGISYYKLYSSYYKYTNTQIKAKIRTCN